MARGFSAHLKEVSARQTDRLVIFKDNQPVAVMMNVQAYQDLVDELEDLRIEAVARDRLTGYLTLTPGTGTLDSRDRHS
ncbi:Phd-YefM [Ectothiorhodospira haloalkaliphila]|uniref:Phd-YefM n=2 Tax=Ectothiorhodospira haloalkaliphila TaxID=421628 RepID=W8KKW0_9GAMM|nr:Phd-YefM [Ectothiorhodospira haloalkaliphila]